MLARLVKLALSKLEVLGLNLVIIVIMIIIDASYYLIIKRLGLAHIKQSP